MGIAMVVAILSLLIVVMVSVAVVGLSSHNAGQSALDRKRLQAVAAAEAGVDDWIASLQNAQGSTICTSLSRNLPTSPVSHYNVTIKLYSTWPPSDTSLITACPPDVQPQAGLVQSVGTAISGGVNQAERTFESLVRLSPSYGGFDAAIFSESGLALVNKLTNNGSTGNDSDIYTNGDLSITNNESLAGSVYAQGNIDIESSTSVKQDVWANKSVIVNNNTSIFGSVKSSTSTISIGNAAHVYGDARAGTSITNSGLIDGAQITNSPETAPPHLPFPQYGWDPTAWQAAGYDTTHTYSDCPTAQSFINSAPTPPAGKVGYTVRITAVCDLNWGNNSSVNLNGNLAIVTDGSVTFVNQNNWTGIGPKRQLFFISPWQTVNNCSGGARDITFSNNTNWSNIVVGVYTPCTANIANQNVEFGQIFGGTVNITNQMTFTFSPILFPGSTVTGWNPEVSYIREIVNP
jgi:cytoskeletal protein CcmA (bactofilin family)